MRANVARPAGTGARCSAASSAAKRVRRMRRETCSRLGAVSSRFAAAGGSLVRCHVECWLRRRIGARPIAAADRGGCVAPTAASLRRWRRQATALSVERGERRVAADRNSARRRRESASSRRRHRDVRRRSRRWRRRRDRRVSCSLREQLLARVPMTSCGSNGFASTPSQPAAAAFASSTGSKAPVSRTTGMCASRGCLLDVLRRPRSRSCPACRCRQARCPAARRRAARSPGRRR